MPSFCNARSCRGTVLTLAIVVSVVITGLITAIAWVAASQSTMTSSRMKLDQAFYAAESGEQLVAWYCKNGNMASITSPVTGVVNGYAYSTSWTTGANSVLTVNSTGSLGSVSYGMSVVVTPPSTANPVFSSAGDFDGKNITITGDVQTGGNFSAGGSGSVTGNLVYAGTASNTSSVSGTVTKAAFTPINMTTLGTTLQAAAGSNTYTGTQTNTTFNFNAISGTNKVIYVNGNVSNPTFVGAGTIYVNGTVSVGAFGSAGSPVNIVSTGVITTSNNITVYGTLYSGSDWDRGKIDLTGLVYVTGIAQSNNGSSSLTQTAAPWFDPRGSGGGTASTSTTFASWSGPQP